MHVSVSLPTHLSFTPPCLSSCLPACLSACLLLPRTLSLALPLLVVLYLVIHIYPFSLSYLTSPPPYRVSLFFFTCTRFLPTPSFPFLFVLSCTSLNTLNVRISLHCFYKHLCFIITKLYFFSLFLTNSLFPILFSFFFRSLPHLSFSSNCFGSYVYHYSFPLHLFYFFCFLLV